MAKYVICPYCNLRFDRDKEEYQVVGRRYAHIKCFEEAEKNKSKEEKDKEELEKYIMKLLNETKINPRVRKQLNDFKAQYNQTYTGMRKALAYFYEVKKNSTEKANGGIGIIPYVYNNAYNYYYNIWMANQTNNAKPIEQYQPQERVIKIPPPKRVEKKKKLFSFLDEEG